MADYQEKEWLTLVASGDHYAFRRLYDRYIEKVYRMSLSYLKSPIAAQDVSQEVFIKVWAKREELPGLSNFPAWLHTMTRNYLINALQKKVPAILPDGMSVKELSENRLFPVEQLDLKEMSRLIRQALEGLSPRQQQVYHLSRERGMTLKQIAAELDISYDTVREHMNAALKSIRHYLQSHYGEMGLLLFILYGF